MKNKRVNQPFWFKIMQVLLIPVFYALVVPIHYLEIIPENGNIYYYAIISMMLFLITPIFLGILVIGQSSNITKIRKVFYTIVFIYVNYGLILGGMTFRQYLHLQKHGYYRSVKTIEKQDRDYAYRILFKCNSEGEIWIGNIRVDKDKYDLKYDSSVSLFISRKDPRIYRLANL